jgi:hypothetical protein
VDLVAVRTETSNSHKEDRMRTFVVALVFGALVSACTSKPPEQRLTPGSRLIYHGGSFGVFTICDRGNRVYLTEHGNTVTVIPNGCPDGAP